ncbi:MAG: NusG domain II-containing protein [Treponema sp.]|jgi:hypothetical protein|nr:NusG domain II-containing protein [Treponema sp.]
MLLKPFDFGIIIPAFGLVLASFFFVYSGAADQSIIHLKAESGEWLFPQDAVETITVQGPLGDTVIAIQGGAARVLSSPCANQTCVAAGAIHSHGQWTACLPNKVMVYIDGTAALGDSGRRGAGDESGVDATVW